MLGQLAGALRDMWKADPNHHTPIDELIYDDAIFVRNGVAHRTFRFDPKTNKLVVTNKTVTRQFTVDELAQILAGLYKRVKPMWLVLLKHSGKLDEEKELVGISQAAPWGRGRWRAGTPGTRPDAHAVPGLVQRWTLSDVEVTRPGDPVRGRRGVDGRAALRRGACDEYDGGERREDRGRRRRTATPAGPACSPACGAGRGERAPRTA
jgi:hypothetical protein